MKLVNTTDLKSVGSRFAGSSPARPMFDNKTYQREYYHQQSDEWRLARKEKKRERVEKRKKWLNELKSAPCTCCGEHHPPEIMEYHHLKGNPDIRVGHLMAHSEKRILEEIKKCILVCPNCHTKIHAGLVEVSI